jgi:hypothetical protein
MNTLQEHIAYYGEDMGPYWFYRHYPKNWSVVNITLGEDMKHIIENLIDLDNY